MQESATCFYQLEWPIPDARVAGPTVWLRGWVVGKPGFDFVDVRARDARGIHLGVLGLPRTDLAVFFRSPRSWLPAEFIIGVPLAAGSATLAIEARDEYGNWQGLQTLNLTVAPDGLTSPRVEGELSAQAGGSTTSRVPHLPFHGHLDKPSAPAPVANGAATIFGWLLHENQAVRRVFATLDGLVFNALESGLPDETLASKVALPAARHARVRGEVLVPPTTIQPACLRVYAELADRSVHLCFAHRLPFENEIFPPVGALPLIQIEQRKWLTPLPSARPRRLLLFVRSLQADDATLRALDVVRHLIDSTRWATRLVASEDGPLRAAFEASECSVQVIDPRAFFAAKSSPDVDASLRALERQIWWGHLDGIAIFDPLARWADQIAHRLGLPVFHDPAETLAWFAPTPLYQRDEQSPFVAPLRGKKIHGAGLLLHATDQLNRHPAKGRGSRTVLVTDVGDAPEEIVFRASLALQSVATVVAGPAPSIAAAAVICPAFSQHPHRALLSALAGGVPVVTTPSSLLLASFSANEVSYIPAGNPLALAHALADTEGNPQACERRVAAAMRIAQTRHAPSILLPRWRQQFENALSF